MKNQKNECRIRFLRRNIFECQTKSCKKKWHVENKKVSLKNYDVENKKKGCFLLQKMFVWIKDDQESVTRWENLQKKKMWTRIR